MMSGSNEKSAELAARYGAMLGVAAVLDLEYTKKLIKVYRDTAAECGWQPRKEDILIGMLCCVGETNKQAIEELESGRQFFARVLTGGVRTAQSIVLQKTRYFDDETRENSRTCAKLLVRRSAKCSRKGPSSVAIQAPSRSRSRRSIVRSAWVCSTSI